MIKKIIFLITWGKIFISSPILYCLERPCHSAPFNPRYFQINYSVSGARANSLGGAFIGVADDATAATINPAGLTALTRPETSTHIRPRLSKIKELAGKSENWDKEKWNEREEYSNLDVDMSYGDIVYPFRKITFAGYWDVVTKAENRFNYNQVPTPELDTTQLDLNKMLKYVGNFPGREVHYDLQVSNVGLAAAYPFTTIPLSIGFSFQVTKLNFSLWEKQYFDARLLQDDFVSDNLEINSAEKVYSVRTIDATDWNFSYTLGMLLKPSSKLSIGFVYNRRPKLEVDSEIFFPAYIIDDLNILPAVAETEEINIKLPDSYGIGVYYRLTDWLRISSDIVRIDYSDILTDDLTGLFPANFDSAKSKIPDNPPDLKIDDAIEFHFGMEYLLPFTRLDIAIRGGVYTDPFHLPCAIDKKSRLQTLFPEEKDLIYFTAGFGFRIKNLTIDISAKLSTRLMESESIFSIGIQL